MIRTLEKRQKKETTSGNSEATKVPAEPSKTPSEYNKPEENVKASLPKSRSSEASRQVISRGNKADDVKTIGNSTEIQKLQKSNQKFSSNTPHYGRIVWISDPNEGFISARIMDLSTHGFTLKMLDSQDTVFRPSEEVFPCEDDMKKPVEDVCALMHLNEATLLNNCRLRYKMKKIYSFVANILISINPYQTIDGFYSSQKINEYRGKSLGQKEPHIYAIADKSYREIKRTKRSQSIIISGESGAGKTESQKAVLRYLCENWGEKDKPIQQRLLEINPILEAFGNAKTRRNNNSSRFGKFMQIYFADNGKVEGGYVSHYLLETSRICSQAGGERNYHIFYQLIAGSSPELYKHCALDQPSTFNYLKRGFLGFFTHLNSSSNSKIPKGRLSNANFSLDTMVDDYEDFQRLEKAMKLSNLNGNEILFIFTTIAGILHLGNIEFEENTENSKGGCKISEGSEPSIKQAARLLGLEAIDLKLGLCARIMQTTKGGQKGTLIRVPLKPHEASAGRDALSKAIYSRLFDWLVAKINQSIPFEKSPHFIGVLDVAGFEFYAKNSFEQFCINFCNEKLQHFFNERILKDEQELYEKEGLNVRKIEFVDNQDCIELFEAKAHGLFDLLDEESRLPTPSYKNFTKRVHEENKKHFRLDTPRKSKVKTHREMRDDEGFLIRHYAGSVCYETKHFVEKNDDQLHNSLEILIEQSANPLLVSLFSPSSPSGMRKGKLKSITVGGKFKNQLSALLEKLQTTGTHFVRCIKPNNQMKPFEFDGSSILPQLQCAGMTSVMRVMQNGFPSRCSFRDLYASYQKNLPAKLANLDPRMFAKCLFRALGLDNKDFQFGLTKVFFRAGKFAEFDQMMKLDAENITFLISKVNEWMIKARWRQSQYAVWSVIKLKNKIAWRNDQITKIQSVARGYLARRKYTRHISIFRKSVALLKSSKEIEKILSRLNEASRAKWTGSAHKIIHDLEILVNYAKLSNADQVGKAEHAYEKYKKNVDIMILDLKKQQKNDKLEELERKRKKAEEKERQELEKRKEAERELQRRKQEEEQQKAHEAALAENIQKAAAEQEKTQKNGEKEKLDRMVSNRLADADQVALVPPTENGTSSGLNSGNSTVSGGKYDLSHWSYPELRDAINNSNDIALLKACAEEFQCRLRIINEWEARNEARRQPAFNTSFVSTQEKQKYFKYAFDAGDSEGNSGIGYFHFSGQHIQRQLTLRPYQTPQLLIAGRDDLQMCALTLQETALEHKKGAEISEAEFEQQWNLRSEN